jgi:hypothetical protein
MSPAELSSYVSAGIILTAVVVAAMVVSAVTALARQPGVLSEGPGDPQGAAHIARLDRWLASIVAAWTAGALLVTYALGGRLAIFGLLYVVGLAAIGYGLVVVTETGRRLLDAVPQTWLIGAQAFRMAGAGFLLVAASDALPAYFAIPAGSGDFIAGLAAPLVALWWAVGASFARRAAWAWNVFGLLDLVAAVGIGLGLFAAPAAALFGGTPDWLERAATGFQPLGAPIFPVGTPLTFVPTFLVPIAVLLHLLSMRKLATERVSTRVAVVARDDARGGEPAALGPHAA